MVKITLTYLLYDEILLSIGFIILISLLVIVYYHVDIRIILNPIPVLI